MINKIKRLLVLAFVNSLTLYLQVPNHKSFKINNLNSKTQSLVKPVKTH